MARYRTPQTRFSPQPTILVGRRFRVGKSGREYVFFAIDRQITKIGNRSFVKYDGGLYLLHPPEALTKFVQRARSRGIEVRLGTLGEASPGSDSTPQIHFIKEWLGPIRSY